MTWAENLSKGLSRAGQPVGTSVEVVLTPISDVGSPNLKVGNTVPWLGALDCVSTEDASYVLGMD